jgi:hypothetical protein
MCELGKAGGGGGDGGRDVGGRRGSRMRRVSVGGQIVCVCVCVCVCVLGGGVGGYVGVFPVLHTHMHTSDDC